MNPEDAYPAKVGRILERELKTKVKIINAGISGATSASAESRVKFVMKAKPDWVVIALGANDGLRGLDVGHMKKNLRAAVKLAKEGGAGVILVGMKVPPNMGKDYSKKFEGAYRDLAKEIKGVSFLPFMLDRVGGEKSLNQADGIHPNAKGHDMIAETMAKFIIKAIGND